MTKSTYLKEYLLLNFLTMGAFLVLFFTKTEWFIFLLRKEGVVETVNFFVLLIAGLNFMSISCKEKKPFYLFLAFVSFFIALEEIDWGQHFLGFRTPFFISFISDSDSFNFHGNFRGNGFDPSQIYQWGIILYFLALPVLHRLLVKINNICGYSINDKLDFFVIPAGIVALTVFAIVLCNMVFDAIGINRYSQELTECMYALALIYLRPSVRANLNNFPKYMSQLLQSGIKKAGH